MKKEVIVEITITILVFFLLIAVGRQVLMNWNFYLLLRIQPVAIVSQTAGLLRWLLPLLELVIVLALLSKRFRVQSLYLSSALFALTGIYLVTLFVLNVHIRCTCGWVIPILHWKLHIIITLFLLAASILPLRILSREKRAASLHKINYI